MMLVSIGLLVLIEANVKGSNLYNYTLASQSTFVGFTKDQTPLKHPLRYKNTMVLVLILVEF